MFRQALLAFSALLICSDALAVTLVPVALTSTSQTVQIRDNGGIGGSVTATDPTDAIANLPPAVGTASSEAKVADGVIQLSYQGSGAFGNTTVAMDGYAR